LLTTAAAAAATIVASQPFATSTKESIMHITHAHGRRIGGRAMLGMLLATSLLTLGAFTHTAAAKPPCDGPKPPPICFR
jgi:hypothetical protein